MQANMDCFGEAKKLSTSCTKSLPVFSNRIVPAHLFKPWIMVTESENLVSIFDLSTTELLQSWSFDELNKLRLPLALRFLPSNSQQFYIGFHSGNYLREWTVNDKKQLKEVRSKKMSVNVTALLSSGNVHFDTMVVFENGAVDLYQNVLVDYYERNKISILGAGHEIIHIDKYTTSAIHLVVSYLTRFNASPDQVGVYKLLFTKGQPEPKVTNFTVDRSFHAYGFIPQKNFTIGVIKVEDRIEVHHLKSGDSVELINSFGPAAFDVVRSVASCSNQNVCLLGENDKTFTIEVYDSQYCTKLGSLDLLESVSPNDFVIISNQLYIVYPNSIMVYPILNHKLLLSRMLACNTEDSFRLKKNIKSLFHRLLNKPPDLKVIRQVQLIFNQKFRLTTRNQTKAFNVPEEIIAVLFGWTTQHLLEVSSDLNIEKREEILNELSAMFRDLVKVPFNDVFLRACLKNNNIKLEQYLLAIEMLLQDETIIHDCSTLAWISMILDYNFNEFVLKSNKRELELMMTMRRMIVDNIGFYESSTPVKTMLDSLLRSEKDFLDKIAGKRVSSSTEHYSIEVLSFF